jgi:O-phospho-L-seryl-tRNASec:L-selenocysteinyl-tRNA synthase
VIGDVVSIIIYIWIDFCSYFNPPLTHPCLSKGGAIILSPQDSIIEAVSKLYAGRASGSPMMDLFITLLSMGLHGYKHLLDHRVKMVEMFATKFKEIAENHNERLLLCKSNTISFGITLDHITRIKNNDEDESVYLQSIQKQISRFGAMLFTRCVSGTRVVPRADFKTIGDEEFIGFGSSIHNFPHAYLTAACAIGSTEAEINEFFRRLDRTFKEYNKIK